MGSSFSFLTTKPPSPPRQTTLDDLPESCVASVLEHLDPQKICQLAMLNKAFVNS
ncbi:hypothetical protein Leryth_024788 [Lithospermum erythrorhizon]|nr:hypothetical protein Leryth_024788 [Lithospermum erythrorhizon]